MISILLSAALGAVLAASLVWIYLQKIQGKEREKLFSEKAELERQLATLQAEKAALSQRLEEHKQDIQEIKDKIVLELSQAQNKAVQESADQLTRLSKQNLEGLLNPFQSQLKDLQEKIHKTYDIESRERLSLQEQIKMIVQTHEKMTLETSSLTRALRGDSKLQGDWGELTLKRVLEASGLREGYEYQEQGKGLGLRDEEGVLRKPDYLVLLPEERHVVIDSKVVLTAYERYVNGASDSERQQYQKEFCASVSRHVEDLAKKDYSALHGINTPDFTLLFLPSDGAYMLALQSEDQLQRKAYEKRVILTCPSLLLPLLKTVEFVWRQDRQSKNTEKIADSAGKLYDKFVGFLEDLEKVKMQLQASEKSLDEAFSKLKYGRGNLIGKIEGLRKLGAKVKRPIASEWVEAEPEAEIEAEVEV